MAAQNTSPAAKSDDKSDDHGKWDDVVVVHHTDGKVSHHKDADDAHANWGPDCVYAVPARVPHVEEDE